MVISGAVVIKPKLRKKEKNCKDKITEIYYRNKIKRTQQYTRGEKNPK